jgi:hypothetical protein
MHVSPHITRGGRRPMHVFPQIGRGAGSLSADRHGSTAAHSHVFPRIDRPDPWTAASSRRRLLAPAAGGSVAPQFEKSQPPRNCPARRVDTSTYGSAHRPATTWERHHEPHRSRAIHDPTPALLAAYRRSLRPPQARMVAARIVALSRAQRSHRDRAVGRGARGVSPLRQGGNPIVPARSACFTAGLRVLRS